VDAVYHLFVTGELRWWIGGGRALELHMGRSWRDHEDTDVGIIRAEVGLIRGVLAGWEIWVAAGGRLRRWQGEPLAVARAENNLWCRPRPDAEWALDLTINDGDDDAWIFRRDPRLRVRWPDAVLHTADGVPYLAPELQLLFKSRDRRDKDDLDARAVIPQLDEARRRWLAARLAPAHPWQRLATGGGSTPATSD
jgi:hypothetical protein